MIKSSTALLITILFSSGLALAGGVPESEVQQPAQSWQNESVKESPELEKALEAARKAYMETEATRRFSQPAKPVESTMQPQPTVPAVKPTPRKISQPAPTVQSAPRSAPQPAPVAKPVPSQTPKTVAREGWFVKTNGNCSGLDSLTNQVGAFTTPKEYARKMQQRGYQAFVLDLGDGQVKVKVPDQKQSLLFVESQHCR